MAQQLGRIGRQGEEKADPQGNDNPKAQHKDREAMHNLVVCAVDDAVGCTQSDEKPGTVGEPSRHMRHRKGYGTKGIKEDGYFKEVLEVIGSPNVLELCCHLQRRASSLWMYAPLLHFLDPNGQEPKSDKKRERDHREAASDEYRGVCHA